LPCFATVSIRSITPRAAVVGQLVDAAAKSRGQWGALPPSGARSSRSLRQPPGHAIPMNIDGATGVVYAERWRSAAALSAVCSCFASVVALAHPSREMQSGESHQWAVPRHLIWNYTGPPPRRSPAKNKNGYSASSRSSVYQDGLLGSAGPSIDLGHARILVSL